MIYIFERVPEIEEITADSEEQAREILEHYFGKQDAKRWELVNIRGALPSAVRGRST